MYRPMGADLPSPESFEQKGASTNLGVSPAHGAATNGLKVRSSEIGMREKNIPHQQHAAIATLLVFLKSCLSSPISAHLGQVSVIAKGPYGSSAVCAWPGPWSSLVVTFH